MNTPNSNLQQLLRTLEPDLQEGVFVFASLPHDTDFAGLDAIATFREREGLTVVVAEAVALNHQLPVLFRAAWITLRLHSELQTVGLTAAFSGALAKAGISCNVMAGACHDHLFVPVEQASRAMATLRDLQHRSEG
jgi:hypothetical protein